MVTKRTIGAAVGVVILVLYLCVALTWARSQAREQICMGLDGDRIHVADDRQLGFVTSDEMTKELGSLVQRMKVMRITDIDLDSLERYLNGLDKLERALVNRLSDNRIRVTVHPMEPVARLWTSNGRSYYINREGKRIGADARFRVDVPQVVGRFTAEFPAVRLLPLLDYMSAHGEWNALVSMISVRDSANVFLLPTMRGHVINFGDVDNIADKFSRLKTFYKEVLPVKGWEFYDTISVKWDGQIVATRRRGKLPPPSVDVIEELENEGDDIGTMSSSAVIADTLKRQQIKKQSKRI